MLEPPTRRRKNPQTGSGDSSAEELQQINATEPRVEVAHDNKENLDSQTHRQTGGKKPAQKAPTKTKAAPRKGKQSSRLNTSRKASARKGSTSVEPESLDEPEQVFAAEPKPGRKRTRAAAGSGDDSASQQNAHRAKRSRLLRTDENDNISTDQLQNGATSRMDPTPEQAKAAEDSLHVDNIERRSLSPNSKKDFVDMVDNSFWDKESSTKEPSTKKGKGRKNPIKKLAFKEGANGKLVLANKNTDAGSPNIIFLDAITALGIIENAVKENSKHRKKADKEEKKRQRRQAKKVVHDTAKAFNKLGAAALRGVRIEVDPKDLSTQHNLRNNAPGASTHGASTNRELSQAATNGVPTDEDLPDAPTNGAPTEDLPDAPTEPPVTPQPESRYSRLSKFVVSSVKKPLYFLPTFGRTNAADEPQNPLETIAEQSMDGVESSDAADHPNPAPVNVITDPHHTVSSGSHIVSASTPSIGSHIVATSTPGTKVNHEITAHKIALPDNTPLAPKTYKEVGVDLSTLDARGKLMLKIEDFIQHEVELGIQRSIATMREELEKEQAAKAVEQIQAATAATTRRLQVDDRQIEELEHDYQMRIKSAEDAKDAIQRELSKVRIELAREKMGLPEHLPLTEDGEIPGPRNGGYGIDVEYLEQSFEETTSNIARALPVTATQSSPLKRMQPTVEDAEDESPSKRRRVTFDDKVQENVFFKGSATKVPSFAEIPQPSAIQAVSPTKTGSLSGTTQKKSETPGKRINNKSKSRSKRVKGPWVPGQPYNDPDQFLPADHPDYPNVPGRTYGTDAVIYGDDSDDDDDEGGGRSKKRKLSGRSRARASWSRSRGAHSRPPPRNSTRGRTLRTSGV